MVMELCDGGDLSDLIYNRPDAQLQRTVAKQILTGIAAIHAKNVIHRDIKPDNILIAKGPNGPNDRIAKLADFGVSDDASSGLLTVAAGTPAFMAPEQHNKQGYHLPADIWAAGVTLYMLLHWGKHPFIKGQQLDMKSINKGKVENAMKTGIRKLFRSAGDDGKDLTRKMLNADPSKRLSAAQACSDRWFPRTRGIRLDMIEETTQPWSVGDRISYTCCSTGHAHPGEVIACNSDGSITVQLDGANEKKIIGKAEVDRIKVEEPAMPIGGYVASAQEKFLAQSYPIGTALTYISKHSGAEFPGTVAELLPDGGVVIQLDQGVRKKVRWYDAQSIKKRHHTRKEILDLPKSTRALQSGQKIANATHSMERSHPGKVQNVHSDQSVVINRHGAAHPNLIPIHDRERHTSQAHSNFLIPRSFTQIHGESLVSAI
jgi:serine/threonine protein kinase